jgi:hypothetical protein
VRKAIPGTYAMLENKLVWAPGSIDTVLAGGEPKELVATPGNPGRESRYSVATEALSRTSTEGPLAELRRRIIRPRHRRRDTCDDYDGLDSRGDRADEG